MTDAQTTPPDLHMHSDFSCDCPASMEQMCQGALANSVSVLGFTEHFDLLPDDPCYGFFDVDGWWAELRRCRELFADRLTILAGIELGEPHRYPDQMQRLLHEHPWDYALGSLHWVGDELIFGAEYFRRPPADAFGAYFDELHRMVETAEFDILAHMDVVKRFGFDVYGEFQVEQYESQVRQILRTLAQRGRALEINTSQLRRAVNESSPARPVIDWFRQEGGQHVTVGSDAHQPDHVGYALQAVAAEASAAGFPSVTWYRARRPKAAA